MPKLKTEQKEIKQTTMEFKKELSDVVQECNRKKDLQKTSGKKPID